MITSPLLAIEGLELNIPVERAIGLWMRALRMEFAVLVGCVRAGDASALRSSGQVASH
jgi:hypothetical protein